MVYDSFQFFNELEILLLRMHVLNDVVDKFVISESTVTFSGDPKPLYYQENKEMFKAFEHKIIHNVVTDTPMDCDAYERDHHQKCAVKRGLAGCKPDDIIIFSDVDEIPNPDTLQELLPKIENGKIYMLAQRLFYCYLNLEEVSGKLLSVTGDFDGVEKPMWLGTKICRYSLLSEYTTEQLRDSEQKMIGIRVENGGWHFGYMGGGKSKSLEQRVKYKVKSAAHQDYNNRATLRNIRKNLKNHKDMFGRDCETKIVPIDETYPVYLREHLNEYEHLIWQEPKTWWQRFF